MAQPGPCVRLDFINGKDNLSPLSSAGPGTDGINAYGIRTAAIR